MTRDRALSDFETTLVAARAGAPWAWERIYLSLAPSVLGYVRSRGAQDPEDLVGEVFLQVVRNLGGFTGDEHDFRTWVFTIAHRRLIDHRRRAARRPVVSDVDVEEIGPWADAETEGVRAVEVTRALKALGRLTEEQQDVIVLRLVADLSIEDVAAIVRKRPGAVKALQRRGLAALRRELEREGVSR